MSTTVVGLGDVEEPWMMLLVLVLTFLKPLLPKLLIDTGSFLGVGFFLHEFED